MSDITMKAMAEAYHRQYREAGDTFFEDQGIDPAVVDRHLLGRIIEPMKETHARLEGMDVIPYLSAQQRVVAMRVSAFQFDKVYQPTKLTLETVWPTPRPHIFNVGNALPGLRTPTVIVVHDVQSALLLRSAGYRAVALPGLHMDDSWPLLFRESHVVHVHPEAESYADVEQAWRSNGVHFSTCNIESEFFYELGLEPKSYINVLGVEP